MRAHSLITLTVAAPTYLQDNVSISADNTEQLTVIDWLSVAMSPLGDVIFCSGRGRCLMNKSFLHGRRPWAENAYGYQHDTRSIRHLQPHHIFRVYTRSLCVSLGLSPLSASSWLPVSVCSLFSSMFSEGR